ncbi:MAG: hypothetical protein EOO25_06020 [Comamonadaceae bacterium]|nr:MAG: hypothetical protein EOO25_06020 [Comamonadaceae bacterium]
MKTPILLALGALASLGLSGCVAYGVPYATVEGSYYGGPPGHHYQGGHRGPRGDRDHDGVLNRYDRDRDGDGVRNRDDRRPNRPWRQ